MKQLVILSLVFAGVLLGACQSEQPAMLEAEPPPAATEPAQADPTAALHTLFDQAWERRLRQSPTLATYLGDERHDAHWDDNSEAAWAQRHAADRQALEQLGGIDRQALSAADQLNYDLFRHQLQLAVEGQVFRQHLLPVNQLSGVQTLHQILEVMRFDDLKDYENWLARLQGLGAHIDQTIALMRRGMDEGRIYPRAVMRRLPAQIDRQLVSRARRSPYYKPFESFPDDIPEPVQQQFAIAGESMITDVVIPAYRRLKDFFENEYLPATPLTVGLSERPNGAAHYQYLVRYHTTTELSADEIHRIGLDEVKRIRAQMEAVRERAEYAGDLNAFIRYLNRSRRFFYRNGQELVDGYRIITKRIDPELPRLFGTLPRTPYGIRAMPKISNKDAPSAYYYPPAADGSRAGYFYANTYKADQRPRWEMEALAAHEAVPGHHLQLALQQEMGELPEFRRNSHAYTAFVEGWGLYAESLGEDLGLYQSPYSKFGQLNFEMWRAIRLVVDTGLHSKGWSRQRAIDFFKANTGKSDLEIANEVDRYIVWPGQALAYKIGELRIKALRNRAQEALADDFDIRAFHDVVLGSGAVPLDVLETLVEQWIAESQPEPSEAPQAGSDTPDNEQVAPAA